MAKTVGICTKRWGGATQWWNVTALVASICFFSDLRASTLPGVELAPVLSSDIVEEVRLTGTANALRISRLSPAVAGLVDSVEVEIGERVEKGDVLFGLDNAQARFRLDSVRAEILGARIQLDEARRRLREALSVGTGQNIAATEVGARKSLVAAAEADLSRLTAEGKSQEVILSRHQIKAPFAGVVSSRLRDVGEWVTPGDELLTLVDDTHLRLDFQVPQDYYKRINDLSRLLIVPYMNSDTHGEVTIDTWVPVSDPGARTFLLRGIGTDDMGLLPGMAIKALLKISTGHQGLTVLRDALNLYPEGRVTVWVAEKIAEDRYQVHEKRVEVGIGFDDRVEIIDGLEGGELVVSRGNESLEAGMEVKAAIRVVS